MSKSINVYYGDDRRLEWWREAARRRGLFHGTDEAGRPVPAVGKLAQLLLDQEAAELLDAPNVGEDQKRAG